MTVGEKLGVILENKVFQNLKLSKNNFNKKCAPKFLFFNEKIINIRMIFDIESSF